jgi:hypothetical protein
MGLIKLKKMMDFFCIVFIIIWQSFAPKRGRKIPKKKISSNPPPPPSHPSREKLYIFIKNSFFVIFQKEGKIKLEIINEKKV